LSISAIALTGIEIFSDLNVSDRQQIAKLCQGRLYEKNQVVVSHHESACNVYFIISGTVRVTIYSNSGKEVTFRDQHAGQMFGELSAIDSMPRSAHVIALSDATLAIISPEDFWHVLNLYPSVSRKTFKYLSNLVRLLSDRVIEFSTLGVQNRIHAELLRLGRNQPESDGSAVISPAPTHAEIANRVSTHREAVTRELSNLNRMGIVTKNGRSLIITDIDRLHRMVNELLETTE